MAQESLTLTNGQTTYSTWQACSHRVMTWTIDHPSGGASTTYSVEVSNATDQEHANAAPAAAADESIAGILKSAAASFAIVGRAGFRRARLKAVTTTASGTATLRTNAGDL